MQIIVTHPSPIANTRLRRHLAAIDGISDCASATGLTDTYNMAEHMHPDCVVMSGDLSATPEFELLSSLFRIMGIGCVLIGAPLQQAGAAAAVNAARYIVNLPATAETQAIYEAIKAAARHAPRPALPKAQTNASQQFDPKRLILIGASTGGIDALLKTVAHFSDQCPPTLIVQHTGQSFAPSLIRLLNGATEAQVIAAEDGAPISPGHIYLPPHNQSHLCLAPRGGRHLALQPGDLVSGHRPSVDVLFRSARMQARHVSAALLTGMGRDGAQGLLALRQAGAKTFGQDAATSVVYGMPRVAMEMGGVETQLPLPKIGPALLRASRAKVRS